MAAGRARATPVAVVHWGTTARPAGGAHHPRRTGRRRPAGTVGHRDRSGGRRSTWSVRTGALLSRTRVRPSPGRPVRWPGGAVVVTRRGPRPPIWAARWAVRGRGRRAPGHRHRGPPGRRAPRWPRPPTGWRPAATTGWWSRPPTRSTRLLAALGDAPLPGSLRWAAVGPSTAAALRRGRRGPRPGPGRSPSPMRWSRPSRRLARHRSPGIGRARSDGALRTGGGDTGRSWVPACVAKGWQVDEAVAYRTVAGSVDRRGARRGRGRRRGGLHLAVHGRAHGRPARRRSDPAGRRLHRPGHRRRRRARPVSGCRPRRRAHTRRTGRRRRRSTRLPDRRQRRACPARGRVPSA